MKNNEIAIHLQKDRYSVTGSLYQYDYGQRLIIYGATLPETYEVHFSNEQHGSSKTVLGDSTGVTIPDEYLTSGNNLHVWIYLHDGDSDGETEYHCIITVIKRAKPTDQEPTPVQQDIITQTIAALNTAVEKTEESEKVAEDAANSVKNAGATAETLAPGSSATVVVRDVDGVKTFEFGIPEGQKGEQGERGQQGIQGEKGEKGDTGERGPQGVQGIQGIQGPKGETGETGAKGDKGDKGDRGEQGIQGVKGDTGEKGDKGDTGEQGPKGDKGDPGEVTQAEFDALAEEVASVIKNSASGAIASFPDGAARPVDDLTVQIEPVQDLHGYDHPWPAGGGENILDPNITFDTTPLYGLTMATTDGYHYSYSGTATGSGNIVTNRISKADAIILPAGTYISKSGTLSLYYADGTWYKNQYSNVAFTVDAPFYVQMIYCEIVKGRSYDSSDFIALAKGSTAPTEWTPYSNICPITGWDGVKVTVSPTTGEADGQTYSITFPSEAGTVYGGTLDVTTGELVVDWIAPTFDGTFNDIFSSSSYVYPAESNPSTESAFCLRVNSGYEHITGVSIAQINPNGFASRFKNAPFNSINNRSEVGFSVQGNWNVAFIFYTPGLKTKAEWLLWFANNPTQICYKLATPITYHLTPLEITTLLGQNNIWADTGDMSVTYRADTKLYIDNKIAELQALVLEN